MIVIPRGLARAVRAVARKCVSGRPRGPAPAVVAEARAGTLTVWARTADAGVLVTAPAAGADEVLVIPAAVLDAVAGGGDDPVELAVGPHLRGEARFTARGGPQAHPFDAVLPGKQHAVPDPPADWHPVPADFLTALHECGRAAARDATRFALQRVQVRGRDGRVVGTDGRTALLWAGFSFPFADDLLVPALPVFGTREVAAGAPVRVGRTAAHLVVAAGPWRVFLPVDRGARYPDVAGVVPKGAPTVAGIDARDAAHLLGALPGLPGGDAEHVPVTLALNGWVAVRAAAGEGGEVREVRLERSPAAGPAAAVALDRRVLARALALGCATVRVAPGRPVVFTGENRTLVTAPLDPDLVVGPAAGAPRTGADTTHPTPNGRTHMTPHETNGHGRPDPPPGDAPDLLAEAEALRAALAEAAARAARLVAALKARKREQRALTQVWSSLKSLNLGP